MANDLVQLRPHIDQMRTTLSQTAEAERTLVQSLSDALKRMDQETLRSVRNMSAEHDARRAGILNELQALAASIGTFQSPRESTEAAIQQQAERKLSYHDELEANLHALLTEGSRR
jgi:chromosome segregation ATPase